MKPFFNDSIFNLISECMIVVDAEGRIIFFNEGAVRVQHLARRPFQKGIPITDLVPAERKDIVNIILKQVSKNVLREAIISLCSGEQYFSGKYYDPELDGISIL